MNRRDFLRCLSVAAANVALPPAGAGPAGYGRPGPATVVDDGLLAGFVAANRTLWLEFGDAATKAAVLPRVHEQIGTLSGSLREPHGPGYHRRLCELAGDLFQLAGEVFFDQDRYSDAAHCYTTAAEACREAGNYDLWACAIVRHAFIAIFEERFDHALPLLEVADRAARRGDQALSTRHWVSAVAADAFAGAGDLDSCQRELEQAERVHTLSAPVSNGGWLRFDGSRLAEQRGSCFVRLGQLDRAEPALREALSMELSARRRGLVMCDMAFLALQRGEVEEACAHGLAAATIVREGASGVVKRRLFDLRRRLLPFDRLSAVDRFVESLVSL